MINLEKYKKKNIDLSKYRKRVVDGQFTVPEAPVDRQNRIAQYQADARQSAEEERKANSFLGKAGNFGKALVENIAPSEVGLGKTIAGILYQGSKADKALQSSIAQGSDTQIRLLKRIREKEAKGEDTTRLKQAYNRLTGSQEKAQSTAQDLVQLPSNMQAVGQIGGTALDLLTVGTYSKAKTAGMQGGKLAVQGKFSGLLGKAIPSTNNLITKGSAIKGASALAGVPELGAISGQTARGVFTKQGAKNIATGAGIGYASDVTLGLQGIRGENRDGGQAFIPGLGTALGTAIPLTSEISASVKNAKARKINGTSLREQKAIRKRAKALNDLQTKNIKIDKAIKQAERRGANVKKVLSETNLLNGAVDSDGRIKTDKALINFNEFIQPYEGRVTDAIKAENRSVPVDDVLNKARDFIDNSKLSARQKAELQKEIAKNLESFDQFYGKKVPLEEIQKTKIFLGNKNNYLVPDKNIVDKESARFFKEYIEDNVTSVDVKKLNKELSQYYAVKDVLEAMNNKVVAGGRLGKYFASVIGTGVGGMLGGPLTAIAGAEAGSRIKSGMLRNAVGGNINKALRPTKALIKSQKPLKTGKDAIPDVILPKNKPSIEDVNIGGQSKSRGSLKTNQRTTIPITSAKGITKKRTSKATKKQGITKVVGKAKTNPLIEEAKKYETPSEFVKAQTSIKAGKQGFKDEFKGSGEFTDAVKELQQNTGEDVVRGFIGLDKLKATQTTRDSERLSRVRKEIESGVRNPIVVEFTSPNSYDVIDGNTRLGVYKELGIKDVPVVVNKSGLPNAPTETQLFKIWTDANTIKVKAPKAIKKDKIKSDIKEVYKKAPEAKKHIDTIVNSIAKDTGAVAVLADLKNESRVIEKAMKEKGGDVSKIHDIARNTIMPKTPQEVKKVVAMLNKRDDIFRKKYQAPKLFMGYEGSIYNIKTPNGMIAEIQIVSPKMIYGKMPTNVAKSILGVKTFNTLKKETGVDSGVGHKLYEDFRSLSETDQKGKKGKDIIKKSFDYYDKLR